MIKVLESIGNRADCFDTSNTGMSYYNGLLSDRVLEGDYVTMKEYYKFEKLVEGYIEYMTAQEYISRCARLVFHTSYDKAIMGLSNSKIDRIAEDLKSGKKYHMPVLNLNERSQEGRHRMLAMSKAFGEDARGAVLVVVKAKATDEEIAEYVKKKIGNRPDLFNRFYDYIKSGFKD